MHYPNFPSGQELIHAILGEGNQQRSEEDGRLQLLSKFAMEQKRLQVGGALLPDLVEFYTWIHTNLSHLLTRDQAYSITIGRVITLTEANLSKESGVHIRQLYEGVKERYNHYVELIGGSIGAGACGSDNKISTIADDTSLLHFLTGMYARSEVASNPLNHPRRSYMTLY